MDYFKSAATALLAKSSPLPNYTIGDRDSWFEGRTIWSLHAGTRKDDSSSCSILVFDANLPAHNPRRSSLPLARNALRKLRTTRHPDVLKLLDSAETPTAVYIAVERVKPLGRALEEMRAKADQREEWVGWGISKIASAVKFLNADAATTHGTIRMESMFLAASGEWRLGGFELASTLQDDGATLYTMGGLIPDSGRYAPPEVKQGGWGTLRDLEPHALDSYSFALFVMEAYNGSLPPTITGVPSQGRVPGQIFQLLRRMMVPTAKNRLPTAQLLAAGLADGGFFAENRLFKVASGLDSFVLVKEEERMEIMRQLKTSSDSFPPEFLQFKVLPALVNALALASTGQQPGATLSTTLQANRILPLVLQLGSSLSDQEWLQSVAPPILKAFASADRAVRMTLLESLSLYSDRLDARAVSDKIWPNLLTGFGDSAAVIREATVKAILPLSSKLSERILNNDLLRQLARTQVDVEPGIRTNTTILLGSLAPKLSLQTRKKVLVPAFSRSLKDPFVHARNAGLMALMATSESFDGDDSAKLIIPALSPCLVDREKMVRDQAKGAMKIFLAKAEELSAKLPDSALTGDSLQDAQDSSGAQSIIASTAGGAASALASWTLSQFTKPSDASRLPSNSVMTSASASTSMGALGAATPTEQDESLDSAAPSSTKPTAPDTPPPAWATQGDLMDVNDDDDDWTGFEVARPKVARKPLGAKKANGKGRAPAMGNARSAITRSSLAVADVADGDAWDDDGAQTAAGVDAVKAAEGGHPSRSDSPASAFAKAPAWETGDNGTAGTPSRNGNNVDEPATSANDWGAIDDEPEEVGRATKGVSSLPAALNPEEKRAEMERKREERRRRMAKLKESKAAKLASGIA